MLVLPCMPIHYYLLTALVHWDWQSNGKCTEHCNGQGTYAFAVIQYTECWCSNYIPAAQTDTSECMVNCPGFPSEKCGDKDKDLFIYIKLDGSPSGTQGAPESTSADASSTAAPSSSDQPSSTDAPTVSTTIPLSCTLPCLSFQRILLRLLLA